MKQTVVSGGLADFICSSTLETDQTGSRFPILYTVHRDSWVSFQNANFRATPNPARSSTSTPQGYLVSRGELLAPTELGGRLILECKRFISLSRYLARYGNPKRFEK